MTPKSLKFASHLVPLVLSGEKTSTWRLFDDKNLQEGDIVDFYERGKEIPFTRVALTRIVEKPLGQLTAQDLQGHDVYETPEEMYRTLQGYYQDEVGPDTIVKVIWFELNN